MRGERFALITGATSGIGLALAGRLCRMGFNIIACGRDEGRLSAVERMCRKSGARCLTVAADLSDPPQVRGVIDSFFGYNIVLLINSAGAGYIGAFDEADDDDEAGLISLNITAAQLLTKAFCRLKDHGAVLNVCSAAAFAPDPLMATYGASKSYLLSYSAAVDRELRKRGARVGVYALCPGAVRTRFDKRAGVQKPLPGALDADKCAEYAIKGLMRGQKIILPGIKIKLSYLACRLLPAGVSSSVQYRIQKSKII